MPASFFQTVETAPSDPIFGLSAAFKQDTRPHKINLSVGLYKDEALRTPVMRAVKEVEKILLEQEASKEYLPIEGLSSYIQQVGALLLGSTWWGKEGKRVAGAQAPGGTGGLRMGAELLKQAGGTKIYIPEPTWPNHKAVFSRCGLQVFSYPYYDAKNRRVDRGQLFEYVEGLEPGGIVVLHPCCHNPTGIDLTKEEWKELSLLMLKKGLLPFFDCAYQGFGEGLEEDVDPIRSFIKEGHEMVIAVSQAKNFGLYAERIGGVYVVCKEEKSAQAVLSQMKIVMRTTYSNPPLHGASIVSTILSSEPLKALWEQELKGMQQRLCEMRSLLKEALLQEGFKKDLRFLDGKGMFCLTGLNPSQVEQLKKEYGLYMTADGRINLAGLNRDLSGKVAKALTEVA